MKPLPLALQSGIRCNGYSPQLVMPGGCNDQIEDRLRPVLRGLLERRLGHVPANAGGSAGLLQRAVRLLRADPARGRGRGVQGFRNVFVGLRHRPVDGAVRATAAAVDHLHGPARSPPHAQPAQQGLHATRHPVPEGDGHREDRQVPQRGSTPTASTRCRTSPVRSLSR